MSTDYIQVKANIPICKFECPSDAKSVLLETLENHVYDLTSIPRCVEHIKFGNYFNQTIEKDVLPAGLQSIQFGYDFNQPIEKDVLPVGLLSINFGGRFNQLIEKNVLPIGLQSIQFGGFDQPIKKDVLALFYCSKATIK